MNAGGPVSPITLSDQFLSDERNSRAHVLPRVVLLSVLAYMFALTSVGQVPPKAVLVDEFGRLPCDDNLYRIDFWYTELSHNPNSVGLVVIATAPDKKHLGVFHERMMEAHAEFRGASKALAFRYVRAVSEDDLKVQLWRIPPGADDPRIESLDMSFSLPKQIEPFMLGAEYKFGGQICPDPADEPVFADFLRANPAARGNIVVRDRTIERARKKIGRVLRTFQNQYGISRRHLRVFPATLTKPSNHDEPVVEYWYLP